MKIGQRVQVVRGACKGKKAVIEQLPLNRNLKRKNAVYLVFEDVSIPSQWYSFDWLKPVSS